MRRIALDSNLSEVLVSGRVSVDISAISDNVSALKQLRRAPHFMAVVKGNAYGHGLLEVARTALDAGADWLGTAQLTEALALRRTGITAPILTWLYLATASSAAIGEAVEHDVDVSWEARSNWRSWPVPPAGWAGRRTSIWNWTAGSAAAEPGWRTGRSWCGKPPRRKVREPSSSAASGRTWPGRMCRPTRAMRPPSAPSRTPCSRPARPDWTRSCGIWPAPPTSWNGPNSISTWSGPGWPSTAWPPRTTWNRRTSDCGRPCRVPVIGKVCMDQFMVDLGPETGGVAVGDTAVLFGDPALGAASADEWGAAIGSHGDEIINRIAPRLPRAYRLASPSADQSGADHAAAL